jgi:Flp pilus assembly pilin Flp
MGLQLERTWKVLNQRVAAIVVNTQTRLWHDERGQDLIEYALMAATIAVATAAIFPQSIAPNICAIFSKVNSTLGASAAN